MKPKAPSESAGLQPQQRFKLDTPSLSLLVKLGSIAVHVDEMLSPSGHGYDKLALQSLLDDTEVKSWLQQMDRAALLPKKRQG